jgi:hypothetical protein
MPSAKFSDVVVLMANQQLHDLNGALGSRTAYPSLADGTLAWEEHCAEIGDSEHEWTPVSLNHCPREG